MQARKLEIRISKSSAGHLTVETNPEFECSNDLKDGKGVLAHVEPDSSLSLRMTSGGDEGKAMEYRIRRWRTSGMERRIPRAQVSNGEVEIAASSPRDSSQ